MSNVTRIIQLKLDVNKPSLLQVLDDAGEQVSFYASDSLRFEVELMDDETPFDLTDVGRISLEVKKPDGTNPPSPTHPLRMYGETDVIASPAIIEFTAEETAIQQGMSWMTITVYSVTDEVMTAVSGRATVLGNGRGEFAPPPDVADWRDQAAQSALSAAQSAQSALTDADRAQQVADSLEALSTSLSYRGVWSSSVAPPDAQRGWFWLIGEPVSFAGQSWSAGDAALFNGDLWQAVSIQWLLEQVEQDIELINERLIGDRNHLALRSGYATIDDTPSLRPGNSGFTVAGWLRFASDAPNVASIWTKGRLRTNYPPGGGWAVFWGGVGGTGYRPKLRLHSAAGTTFTDDDHVPFARDRWTHCAFSVDIPSGVARTFFDGTMVSEHTLPPDSWSMNTAVPIGIGVGTTNVGNPDSLDRGRFDQGELYMLSFAASESDVRRLMTGDIPLGWRGGAFGGHPGIVLHLDPRNIGPTQWTDPNGHNALYSETGADSAQELTEDSMAFGFTATGADLALGGAQSILLDDWDVVGVQCIQHSGGAGNFEFSYSNGTNNVQFASISGGTTSATMGGISTPTQRKPDAYNRIYVTFTGSGPAEANVVFKIRRR